PRAALAQEPKAPAEPATTGGDPPGAPAPLVEGAVVAAQPEAVAPPEPVFRRQLFFGALGGIGFAAVKHPDLATPKVYGPMLGMSLGVTLSPQWAVGLEFTNIERVVTRSSGGERFSAASSWLHAQAECNGCRSPAIGGIILSYNMLQNVVGPKVDFSPFG